MTMRSIFTAAALTLLAAAPARAACAFQNTVPLKTLTAAFDAWKAVTSAMQECGNVQAELDQDFRLKQPAAFAANPALYHIGGVANETMVPLLNAGTIRPLDDLVAKYGKHLTPNQLIKVDGKVMAIAMMVNSQHLMYRKDVFDQLGLAQPKTYGEVIAAAQKIKAANAVPFPIAATMRSGWNLAMDFSNLYLAQGADFFGADNKPAINNPAGVKTLETMKALTAYMDPEYLNADSSVVQRQFQQGRVAIANFWGSRAGALDDPKESTVVGKVKMAASAAAAAGGKPAGTVWWDGAVIAKNISDAEADAAFRVLMEGMDREMVEKNNNAAVWLIEGFKPGPSAEGVIANLNGGAPAYPASTRNGLMVAALGAVLADHFTGKLDAAATLKAAEERYTTAAREAGLIK
jgi:ABC-type glycerol-3-phosphate transport system substrate-binding protein